MKPRITIGPIKIPPELVRFVEFKAKMQAEMLKGLGIALPLLHRMNKTPSYTEARRRRR